MKWRLNQKMKNDIKIQEELRKHIVYCKNCGWKNHIYRINKGRIICKNCGVWIYESDKKEFEYKLKEEMNKCKFLN